MENVVTLYATLRQGLSPVIHANVRAQVEAGSHKWTIDLLDNGAGNIYFFKFCNLSLMQYIKHNL